MDAREEFETAYYYLHQTLMILARPPLEQSTQQGNYNTAWELKSDMTRNVSWVLGLKTSDRFTPEQKRTLSELLSHVEAIPVNGLLAGDVLGDNIAAMKHAAWEPARRAAKELLLLLRPITVANDKYFEERASAPFALPKRDVALYLEHAARGTLGRQDWQRFLHTPLPGSPDMDTVRLRCVRIEQFGGTGSGEAISLTLGAKAEIEQLLQELEAEL